MSRPVAHRHDTAVDIHLSNRIQIGITFLPIDERLKSREADEAHFEIEIERIAEGKAAYHALSAQSIERLRPMQRQGAKIFVWRSRFRPAGIFKTCSFKSFGEQQGM